ncbi:UDP-N-acetylmuramoyl-L-alanyl-D-glutamate--2,6-diaminopimelate ligase [Candidatus Poribacteria bacterium]|nr:UDP-N-acetylmuramoyl-L-alanyl-D-glutamate--2,6-diaminopimelate ligase [Candidatus Poribacteria bacterium]
MNLKNILSKIEKISVNGNPDIEISSITQDSRKVKSNSLFVAIKGLSTDGNKYINDAIKKGAVCIITENELSDDICHIIVKDASIALSEAACVFYDNPSDKLKLIGITGTNGKTTTSFIIDSILRANGKKTGVIGTVTNKIGDDEISSSYTTPDPVEFQSLLNTMVQAKVEYAVIEVSSHALAQKRVWGSKFDVAVFTNLTHDHLDYHKTMEDYGNAKKELFINYLKRDAISVINIDDIFSEELIKSITVKIITYGFLRGSNVMAFNIAPKFDSTSMSIYTQEGIIELQSKLVGIYNVYNIMAAVAASLALKIDPEIIKIGLEEMPQVPGRFEFVEGGQPFPIVVDYAHTPDGLINVLQTIRAIYPGRLIVVFGATGDRDKTKRPLMGEIVSTYSDLTIVTSDDPHSEDPEKIADEVISGISKDKTECYLKILDRRQAILKALSLACPQDFVLIAGKGHEKKQVFKDKAIEFNDKDVVLEIIKAEG